MVWAFFFVIFAKVNKFVHYAMGLFLLTLFVRHVRSPISFLEHFLANKNENGHFSSDDPPEELKVELMKHERGDSTKKN